MSKTIQQTVGFKTLLAGLVGGCSTEPRDVAYIPFAWLWLEWGRDTA